MFFAVDRIEKEKIVLENIKTKEKRIVNKKDIPRNIQDGTIIKIENNQYTIDKEKTIKRKKDLEEKLNQIKK